MPRSKGRTGRPWRRLAATVRARAAAGEPCWLCGHPIDLTLPARHPRAFSVDHVTSLAAGGAPRDLANCAPAHLGCNARKGDGTRRSTQPLARTSRAW